MLIEMQEEMIQSLSGNRRVHTSMFIFGNMVSKIWFNDFSIN
jgi:hypothetical protein